MKAIAGAALVLSVVSSACGGAPAGVQYVTTGGAKHGGGGPEFPSRASLDELARQPVAPPAGEERKTLAVDEWQPEEATVPAAAPATEAEALVKSIADARFGSMELDPQLACTAGQVARFFAAHAAFPDQQLQAHIAGVCGATQPTLGLVAWATPSPTVAQSAHHGQWYDAIKKQLTDAVPAGTHEIAGAEYSDGKTNVFAAAAATSEVDWESRTSVANADGTLELSGSVRGSTGSIQGFSNAGAHGVRECRSDPRVAPPRFHVTCQLDPGDASAWLDLEVLTPGRVLAKSVARVLVRREGTSLAFSLPSKNGASQTINDPVSFGARLF
jgi:hypothetical protein